MKEKRKSTRAPAKDHFIVVDRESDTVIGRVLNMTEEGMMVVSKVSVETESRFHCRMALPEKIAGQNQVVFDVECKWCRKDDMSGMFEAGFQLHNVSEKDAHVIGLLLQSWTTVKSRT